MRPQRSWWDLRLGELWRYRDLIGLFVWRDFKLKQTVSGKPIQAPCLQGQTVAARLSCTALFAPAARKVISRKRKKNSSWRNAQAVIRRWESPLKNRRKLIDQTS